MGNALISYQMGGCLSIVDTGMKTILWLLDVLLKYI